MGRYYTGDIEGKFFFGIQPSNAADRFGYIGQQPNYLEYYFMEEDLPKIKEEIANIENHLGSKLNLLTDYFKANEGYNLTKLAECFKIPRNDMSYMLSQYADLILGRKILSKILEQEECFFNAEL